MKKKWLTALLIICVTLAALPLPASAVESAQLDALEAFLREEIRNGTPSIRFDSDLYGRPSEDEIRAVFTALFNTPELFVLDGSFSWSARGTDYQVTPRYRADILADYDNAKILYEQGVSAIAEKVNPNWTDLQKVLFINDQLALGFSYDTSYTNYDVYSFLKDKKGVCEAYSLFMMAVLSRLNIPCSYVKSDSINHMWNIVQLDGAWYHLDATWNDPMPDRPGYARHVFFLLSTDAMKSAEGGEHYEKDDWVFGENILCDSTKYDSYFWRSSVSPFVSVPAFNQWFYLDADGLNLWDGLSDTPTNILSFANLFHSWYPNYKFQGYTGTSGLFLHGDKLYFNTAFNLLSYDLNLGVVERLKEYLNDGNAISCFREENQIICLISRGGVTARETFPLPEIPVPDYPPDSNSHDGVPTPTPAESEFSMRVYFSDVPSASYCFDAVAWAVDRKITNGTSPELFSPDNTCTTAQVITFLWRAAGSPGPIDENPFPDLSPGVYYYYAALWAYQAGLLPDHAYFHGDAPCTRAAAVEYLWKLAGSPLTEYKSFFTDIAPENAAPVDWAVERGITKGTSDTTFSPDQICTRGQIVTFLYRNFA